MRWDFFVRHYADDDAAEEGPEARDGAEAGALGVLYPRAGTLGGCTAHNALILVCPQQRGLEPARRSHRRPVVARRAHARVLRATRTLRAPPRRTRGEPSWVTTRAATAGRAGCRREVAVPAPPSRTTICATAILESARAALRSPTSALTDADRRARLESQLDPNDWRVVSDDAIGLRYTPLTTTITSAVGARERVLDVQPAASAIGSRSSCTRSRRGCCSTTRTARSASST